MKKKLAVITIIMAMLLCICSCGSKIPTRTETADSFLTVLGNLAETFSDWEE